jgi:hypothetical protein
MMLFMQGLSRGRVCYAGQDRLHLQQLQRAATEPKRRSQWHFEHRIADAVRCAASESSDAVWRRRHFGCAGAFRGPLGACDNPCPGGLHDSETDGWQPYSSMVELLLRLPPVALAGALRDIETWIHGYMDNLDLDRAPQWIVRIAPCTSGSAPCFIAVGGTG